MRYGTRLLGSAALSALLAGCVAKAEDRVNPPMRELLVKASDFSFAALDTVESGYVRIRMENVGSELHHLQLLRLDEGLTAEGVLEHARHEELVFPGAKFVGGTTVPGPSNASEAVVDLRPGRYLMVCYMSSGKVRHLLMGMTRQLVVIPAKTPGAATPMEDERMRLRSYGFEMDSVLKPGPQLWRVENESDEPHELFLARLPEDRTQEELITWLQKPNAHPPFVPAGGTMALSRGEVAFVPLNLTPGKYVLLCFVPDSKDRLPHVAHGMMRMLTVPGETVADWNQARSRGRR